ncbi:exodeoxyribonuclease V subunit beta, partial [bacterium]
MLRRPDGGRRLPNVLHGFEVIHQAAHEGRLSVEGLLTWFGEKVAVGEKSEEYQIRLETDEKAVKIVTVHVSKGLEYPIVFCPFMWGGIRTDNEVVTFHEGFDMVRDIGSDDIDNHRVLAEKEILAESLRLLYVALTRAKYRCYLVAGKVSSRSAKSRPETSPLSYLFHAPGEIRTVDDLVSRLVEDVGKLTAAEMEEQLREFAGEGKGYISVVPLPPAGAGAAYVPSRDEGKPLAGRTFAADIDRDWRVASFTSFAKHDPVAVELPDRDETSGEGVPPSFAAGSEEPQGMSIFTFPRGVEAGIFLHWIFEQIDFADAGRDKVSDLVEKGLERYGYPAEWQPHLCAMIAHVLAAPLSSG